MAWRSGEEDAAALREAERAGLRLAQIIRTIALLPLFGFALWGAALTLNFTGPFFMGSFVAIGLAHYALLRARRDLWWHRYAFVAADLLLIGVVGAFVPMSTSGEVPQIMVFRAFGVHGLFLIVAMSALSLSPRFVLWTGAGAAATIAGVFLVVTAGMERTVSWGDLPPRSTAAEYVAVLMDPDFVGRGNRVNEILVMIGTALLLAVAVGRARQMVRDRAMEVRERQRIEALFGTYVPAEVRDALIDGEALAAQEREATILYCDVEGFTRFSEGRTPSDVIDTLDAHFERVTEMVARHNGVVVGFAGDAVLAAFNLPVKTANHAAKALAAGREIVARTALPLRVGIATGPVAAGTLGGGRRRTYTVYGDTVNLAQRLEALNKETGTRLLVCSKTAAAAGDAGLAPLGDHQVRGRVAAVGVFTVPEAA
ncbi:MAG: adenylate/guanylate cyclase domain-containing protein [Pseudomonadota bacterium]